MRNEKLASFVLVFAVLCFLVFSLAGCTVVRTRQVVRERVDQDLAWGNRGYISGKIPPQEAKERKKTRKTYEIEIELSNPFKFEKASKDRVDSVDVYETLADTQVVDTTEIVGGTTVEWQEPIFESYTVQKGDTLQKISLKFYGTTRKWQKIYQANKDVLKSPDRVYLGQKLNIPME